MRRACVTLLLAVALAVPGRAVADERPAAGPALRAGAIELGLSGALTATEGATQSTLLLRGGRFAGLGRGLVALEGELGYSHVASLDALGLELALSYQARLGGSACYPYVAVAAGSRERWVGSFRDTRVPVGATLGVRLLAGERAAARVEYRVRRLLRDPVADVTEQQVVVGLSLLFRNAQRR